MFPTGVVCGLICDMWWPQGCSGRCVVLSSLHGPEAPSSSFTKWAARTPCRWRDEALGLLPRARGASNRRLTVLEARPGKPQRFLPKRPGAPWQPFHKMPTFWSLSCPHRTPQIGCVLISATIAQGLLDVLSRGCLGRTYDHSYLLFPSCILHLHAHKAKPRWQRPDSPLRGVLPGPGGALASARPLPLQPLRAPSSSSRPRLAQLLRLPDLPSRCTAAAPDRPWPLARRQRWAPG